MTSLYFHIPFCKKRCAYCDFITFAGLHDLLPEYTKSLIKELKFVASEMNSSARKIHTIFFGGGTPSLMSAGQIGNLLQAVRREFDLDPLAEVSLEANPGTVNLARLEAYRKAGINRLSLGAQSFNDNELRTIGRIHNASEITKAVSMAKNAGFSNISLDLIFGLPGQSIESWKKNLDTALELEPEHLSLYSLILEEGTPLKAAVDTGKLSLSDDDFVADLYDLARRLLRNAGWEQYEISNWAKDPRFESAHNKVYWKNGEWLGFGVAAHSHINDKRFSNVETIPAYLERMSQADVEGFSGEIREKADNLSPATVSVIRNDRLTEMKETMMLGFRLVQEGVDLADFFDRYGVLAEEYFRKELGHLFQRGLIETLMEDNKKRLRVRSEALGIANQVFEEFV